MCKIQGKTDQFKGEQGQRTTSKYNINNIKSSKKYGIQRV